MANESVVLWVDVENNTLLTGWESNTPSQRPTFKQGDNIKVEMHFVRRVSTNTGIFFDEVPTAGASIRLAVGNPDAIPTGGTWTLDFNGEQADFLYNASASSVQTALNAFASITALGGVTVEKVNGETTYRISFNNKVALTDEFTGDGTNLLPSSSVIIDEIKVGSPTVRGVWQIKPTQIPVAYQGAWTAQDPAVITTSVLQSGTTRIKIEPSPKDGTFILSVGTYTTTPISVYATALDVQNAISAVVDGFEVQKSGAFIWDVSQNTTPLLSITANGAGLISFDSIVGEVNFNNYETATLLAGATSKNTTLEIEMTIGSSVATVLQTPCTIISNLINETIFAPTPFEEHLTPTEANALFLKQASNLSDLANTATARTNLSVYSIAQTDGLLALKADLSHTHGISDVTGLQTALDGKASLSGATFTGKVNHTSVGGAAGVNIGIGGTSTNATVAGDLWISTGGTNLNFRDGTGAWRVVATQGQINTFSTNQIISGSTTTAMLRVTQTGTGESLRIEDETNPDSTPFVVGADGRVGIHGTPAVNTNHKLAIYNGNIVFSAGYGLAFGDGTTMTSAATGNVSTGVTNTFTTNQIIDGTTTSPMLRITQGGTGDALRVQDVSGDASAFVIDQNGLVGINGEPHGGTIFPLTINNGDLRFVGITSGYGASGITFADGSRLSSAAGVGATTFFAMTDVNWDSGLLTPDTDGSFPVIRFNPTTGDKSVKFVPSYYWNGIVSMPPHTSSMSNNTGDPSTSWTVTMTVTFSKPNLALHTGTISVQLWSSPNTHLFANNNTPYYGEYGAYYGKQLVIRINQGEQIDGWNYSDPNGTFFVSVVAVDGYGSPLSYVWSDLGGTSLGGDYRAYVEQTTSPFYDRPVTERGFQNALTLFLLQQNALPEPAATPRQLSLTLDEASQLWSMTPRNVFTGKVWLPSVTTASAPLNIGGGSVNPTTPSVGDIWQNGDTLFYRGSSNLEVASRNTNNVYTGTQTIDISSASTAVRITQRGTGSALVVEDNTTPDSTAFIVNNNGVVGIQRANGWSPSAGVFLDVGGKGVFTPTTTYAGINIGTVTATPTSPVNGDIWIGTALNFRGSDGSNRTVPVLNTSNTFTAATTVNPLMTINQTGTVDALSVQTSNATNTAVTATFQQSGLGANVVIRSINTGSNQAALRVEQRGLGHALVVEDSQNPDTNSFVIDSNGNVGIGVEPATFTATEKLEVKGNIKFNDGTVQSTAFTTAQLPTAATASQARFITNATNYLTPNTAHWMLMNPNIVQIQRAGFTVTNTGTITLTNAGWIASNTRTGTAGACSSRWRTFGVSQVDQVWSSTDKSRPTSWFDFSNPAWLSGRTVCPDVTDSVFSWWFYHGKAEADGVGDIARMGFGWKVTGGAGSRFLTLHAHNGTTLSAVTSTYAVTSSVAFDWDLISDGAGTVQLYVNGTLVATSTGGPTGNTNITPVVWEESVATSAAATSPFNGMVHSRGKLITFDP